MPGNTWIIIAVVAVIIVRRFSAVVGGISGMAVSAGIGVWGIIAFSQGSGIALLGFPLNLPMFLGLIAIWFAIEAYGLVGALKRRRQAAERQQTPGSDPD